MNCTKGDDSECKALNESWCCAYNRLDIKGYISEIHLCMSEDELFEAKRVYYSIGLKDYMGYCDSSLTLTATVTFSLLLVSALLL